ncbi:MAG TPA: T9SS type A sorting domain-containing protein [Flavobacteriales bacterium]|nr:T9SS type A sorting domain-containing protein [Flavobacteriales bacterium]
MKPPILTCLALLLCTSGPAMTVTVSVTDKICSAPGSCKANIQNGIPPFTYQWSNGGTTQTIDGLGPGTYTVTVTDNTGEQATASGTVAAVDYEGLLPPVQGQRYWPYGNHDFLNMPFFLWSPDEFPGVPVGPPPYLFNGMEPQYSEPAPLLGTQYDYYYVNPPGDPGDIVQMTFTDGNGCSGTFEIYVAEPFYFEQSPMELLEVNGACNGEANGSFRVSDGGLWTGIAFGGELLDAQGQTVQPANAHVFMDGTGTELYEGLLPGDYRVARHMRIQEGTYLYDHGGDTLFVTVPDLGNTCGQVIGTVFIDTDLDCLMGSPMAEPRVGSALLEFEPGPYYALTAADGTYSTSLPNGAYTVTQTSPHAVPHCTPAGVSINVGATPVVLDFADTTDLPFNARIQVYSTAARPGFPMGYTIKVANPTMHAGGAFTVALEFDGVLEYSNAYPQPASVSGTTITWDGSELPPFSNRTFKANFMVPPDMALLGTVLYATATLTTTTDDADLSNNTATSSKTITGSYDPNDKQGISNISKDTARFLFEVDEWIDYTIRFQNTGTDTAFTVVVRDELSEDLAIGTLDILGASHDFVPSFSEGRELVFTFNDILLPDSATDLLGSQGFISFRIKPVASIQVGDVIGNTAAIYFDFNDPVITNTTEHTVSIGTGVEEATMSSGIRVHPNPTNDILYVHLSDGADQAVRVFAVDGRAVEVPGRNVANGLELDVRTLSPGTYLLHIPGGVARFVKW